MIPAAMPSMSMGRAKFRQTRARGSGMHRNGLSNAHRSLSLEVK